MVYRAILNLGPYMTRVSCRQEKAHTAFDPDDSNDYSGPSSHHGKKNCLRSHFIPRAVHSLLSAIPRSTTTRVLPALKP
jgi:hypothetical protein